MLVEYKNALSTCKLILIYFQIGIVAARFLWLIGPSLQLVLQITQLAAVSIIYRRPKCSSQAKYFLVMSVLLLYLLLYNYTYWFFNINPQKETLIVQHFKNDYHIWGYSLEILFRIFSGLVVWRSYELAILFETTQSQSARDQIQ